MVDILCVDPRLLQKPYSCINIICIVKTNPVDFDKVDEERIDDGVVFIEISGLERENISEIVPKNTTDLARIIKNILQI